MWMWKRVVFFIRGWEQSELCSFAYYLGLTLGAVLIDILTRSFE